MARVEAAGFAQKEFTAQTFRTEVQKCASGREIRPTPPINSHSSFPCIGTAMRHIKLIAVVCGLSVSACSTDVSMFPIEGPVTSKRPLPVLVARADGITGNTGNLTMTLADQQTCSGKWSSAAPQFAAVASTSLFSQYGNAAGLSVIAGNMPGVNRGEAFLTCSRGTTVQAEFYTGSGTANGYGVAKDSDGNVYKMLF